MGRNKALLPYRNAPLIEHMTALLKASGCEYIYISGQVEGYGCIADSLTGKGPLAGVEAMLNHLPAETHVLFCPVDMPLLTTDNLTPLMVEAEGCDAVSYSNLPLPLLLKNTAEVRQLVATLLQSEHAKERSIRNLISKLNTHTLTLENAEHFKNTNTPEEWAEIL